MLMWYPLDARVVPPGCEGGAPWTQERYHPLLFNIITQIFIFSEVNVNVAWPVREGGTPWTRGWFPLDARVVPPEREGGTPWTRGWYPLDARVVPALRKKETILDNLIFFQIF